ncbi:MAG TPA: hypothetical protein VMU15_14555 [Anaeromyxobacter sp.]|nr:hypothetical protein [Anaeromyxobacter sp.]
MEEEGLEGVAAEVDALVGDLDQERARSIAGVELEPSLARLFAARSRAAHRATAKALREAGQEPLARRVAALRAERAAAEREERWRSAEARASASGPDGKAPLAALEVRLTREPDRERRLSLGRAAAEALGEAAAEREAMLEARARAAAEVGSGPDWQAVVEGDELLARSDDAYREVLGHHARRDQALSPASAGDLARADLLHLLSLAAWDGLLHRRGLGAAVRATASALRLDLDRVKVDEGERPAQWPGVHATGPRLSFRPRGGAGDWQDLLGGLGQALAAAHVPPHRRDPVQGVALGWLLGSLLREPRWLMEQAGVERRHLPDLRRELALRRLFALRASAAAFRVACEVERGLSGAAWRQAYREAMTGALGAAWDGVRAARDGDAALHAAALAGAGAGERLREEVRERFDEDWWRNPRTAEFLAGVLAAGALPELPEGGGRAPSRAAAALSGIMEGKG